MLNQQFAFDRPLQDKGRLNRDVKSPIARAAAGSEKAAGGSNVRPPPHDYAREGSGLNARRAG
ncbi:Phosphotransferase system, mannose/fructose/N -acetylgalactosamine-specific component IIC [Serratia entomophila]|nr:Phosphotransferase system, mannose/fructose/N -acetylgalactosamine-specific component IIC [Serratia entomophila]CAI1111017.1 Phosphotransferase system, mannose/fructose/N -acetylgalactosamine-specific component IIC [Serratia entomophila]CAI1717649.1 Phosphotransferase system, mannose/fructose/N -acetylgalactosamine-specific component IIC [Serratia entomophila]CAI1888475.1 Phosphotransferase system, mannose/fructose/N -acetylgalactosamine-specific component IIC [Serratia entomophila]CAI189170